MITLLSIHFLIVLLHILLLIFQILPGFLVERVFWQSLTNWILNLSDNLWWVIWWGVDGHIIIWTVICSISKSNVMSKKSTIFKFVWMLVINSSVSKMDIIFFLQRSIVLPFAFLKTTNPSLGCNQLFFGAVIRYIITQVHTFLLCLDTP